MSVPVGRPQLKPLLPIRIFLSSPGDLFPIRDAVKRLIEELNHDPRYEDKYKLILYAYEDRVPPIIAEEPQRTVDRYTLRPDASDIFLCLLWRRLGTPTEGLIDSLTGMPYLSGTVYELLTAYRAHVSQDVSTFRMPAILLYRRNAPIEERELQTPAQERSLEDFLRRFRPGGDLTGLTSATFTSAVDLVTQLRDRLARVIEVELRDPLDAKLRQLLRPRLEVLLLPSSLRADYIERVQALDELRQLVLGSQRRVGVVAVQGQGGLGKTVLAKALCFDRATRSAFKDGILWAELGQNPNVLETQRTWIQALGGNPSAATTVREGIAALQDLLNSRTMLLVLDDVWQQETADAFLVGGPECRILITTRNSEAAPGAHLIRLGVMHRGESKELLRFAGGSAVDDRLANEIAERLGDLPLALDLVGRQLQAGIRWATIRRTLDVKHDVRYIGLDQGKVYAVIASSVDALPDPTADRFHELAIFAPDEPLDRSAVANLYKATGKLDEEKTEQLLGQLHSRALVQPGNTLHDLVHDYLRFQYLEKPDRLRLLHRALISQYGGNEQWPFLPLSDVYIWRRLAWHLVEGGMVKEARILLTDARYLERKIALLGTEAAAADIDLLKSDDKQLQLFAAALRRSAHILDVDGAQLKNQIFGRLGTQSPLHDAPTRNADWQLLSPTLSPAGVELRLLGRPGDPLKICVFSPDGRTLATAGEDGQARLWEASTGRELRVLKHDGAVSSCAFSPDGRTLATAVGPVGHILIWDQVSDVERRVVQHGNRVSSCAFSPDGRTLATAGEDSLTIVWEVPSGKKMHILAQGLTAYGCAFSPNGTKMATTGADGVARLWEVSTGQEVRALATHGTATACAFSPDGLVLATGGRDGAARLWEVSTGQEVRAFQHFGEVNACAFSPDGRTLATASTDGVTRLWEAGEATEMTDMVHLEGPTHQARVTACAFSPDGRIIASAGNDATVQVWDPKTRATLQTFEHAGWPSTANACAFSPDGRVLATAGSDGAIRLWAVSSGKELRVHDCRFTMNACTFSPEGRLLGAVGRDGLVRLWEVSSGKEVHTLSPRRGRNRHMLHACAFSPDGRIIASAGSDGEVHLWAVSTGVEVGVHRCDDWLYSCAFSPDGRALAAAGDRGRIFVWDTSTGAQLCQFGRDGSQLNGCAFGRDGRLLVTAGADGAARLWEIRTGVESACFNVEGQATACAANPKVDEFAVGDWTGRIHILRLRAAPRQ